ncbi:hypothetical protein [Trichormus variabilis]|uniref:Uncharacterized protein n=1 Tax=Trichormus variabilis SAG 1403-4b TaxID=447716 RepID=A0A3S1I6L4_ANAVA|nr:hypothetical protein [Trichormus variabilis]MBD2629664.1 hypothetical protein [Trichormus variabilis FACHB-164]RUS92918.1 hypothetical protein DSM107003_46650 [Trichormus variabilis SAG 1403-4b]
MKTIVLDPSKINRTNSLKIFEKINRKLLKQIRADRNYQTPKGYISWDELSGIVGVALSTCDIKLASADFSAFLHSHRMSLWFVQDAPLYCITPELFQAFDNTDVLNKPEVLAGWKPSLPTFLVALPSGVLRSPSGDIDYLVVHCTNNEHPEWGRGNWRDIQIPDIQCEDLHCDWSTTSTKETVWMSSSRVADNGDLIYNDNNNLGRNTIDQADKEFIDRVRNFVVNILLSLEYSPNLTTEVSNGEIITKSQGFGVVKNLNIRRARWLGKDYQTKSQGGGTHSMATPRKLSPHTHWRRGHWRVLEPSSDNKWKQSKRIWIEPVLVNGH